ncbi:MAG: citrate/2-methylcitrate synthase [Chloroflexi bacterium]|nr:MAG: citrate/2-methylcitrate synthase [Chloroflexota bacterium]
MTIDTSALIPGLEGVPIAESSISQVDGVGGHLYYRGYSIEDLTQDTPFEEIAALLYDGQLPDAARSAELKQKFEAGRALTPAQIEIARSLATQTHPMFALQAAVAALAPKTNDFDQMDFDAARERGIALTAKVGHLVGVIAQAAAGRPYDGPKPGETHAHMVLRMITGTEPSALHEHTMNALLVLQADHSSANVGTFTARVVTSSRAEPESVVSSAIGALSGPAHGGANEAAIRLFVEIGSPENVESFLAGMVERRERIPGFGHRIYHVKDPRSAVIQRLAAEMIVRDTEQNFYNIALKVEELLKERLGARGLWPNVDLFSGCVFHALDIPIDFFTPIFAASRALGWAVNMKEQLESGNRLFRPTQIWNGEAPRSLS